ncbi:hypothetical protein ACFZB4_42570 [Streptomyces pseudovenezuelae]|uniref:hypothetical protein n=1 Tax=Streptomyces pseudovenezuelae TaxID=67350 RepID=UPI0036E99E12
MTTEMTSAAAWLKEITAQARTSPAKVFSVSVPLNHPYSPDQAPEDLVAAAIEGVEVHGWRLENVSTYGATFSMPPWDPDARFWALLVFRTTYRGRDV